MLPEAGHAAELRLELLRIPKQRRREAAQARHVFWLDLKVLHAHHDLLGGDEVIEIILVVGLLDDFVDALAGLMLD